MMNGKKHKVPSILMMLLPALLLLCEVSASWAGNTAMIEKKVEELDRLNKKIVGKIENVPQSGHISTKAVIKPDGNIIKYKSRDHNTSQTEEGTIEFQDSHLLTFPNKEGEQKHVKEKN